MGSDWIGSDRTPNSGFPDLPLPQPQLRVFTSNEFQAAVYSSVFCSVYCNSTAVILKSVLPNEKKKIQIFKKINHFFLFSCMVVFMYGT